MARNNRGGSNRGSRNNNPSGRNQYSSNWGVMEMARERPIAAVAVAAGAAAAGLFLWTKRSQISDQLSSLSDQFSEWTQGMGSSGEDFEDDTAGLMTSSQTSSRQRGMSETGGGNASLGASSGGGGSTGSASGRGRARSTSTAQQ